MDKSSSKSGNDKKIKSSGTEEAESGEMSLKEILKADLEDFDGLVFDGFSVKQNPGQTEDDALLEVFQRRAAQDCKCKYGSKFKKFFNMILEEVKSNTKEAHYIHFLSKTYARVVSYAGVPSSTVRGLLTLVHDINFLIEDGWDTDLIKITAVDHYNPFRDGYYIKDSLEELARQERVDLIMDLLDATTNDRGLGYYDGAITQEFDKIFFLSILRYKGRDVEKMIAKLQEITDDHKPELDDDIEEQKLIFEYLDIREQSEKLVQRKKLLENDATVFDLLKLGAMFNDEILILEVIDGCSKSIKNTKIVEQLIEGSLVIGNLRIVEEVSSFLKVKFEQLRNLAETVSKNGNIEIFKAITHSPNAKKRKENEEKFAKRVAMYGNANTPLFKYIAENYDISDVLPDSMFLANDPVMTAWCKLNEINSNALGRQNTLKISLNKKSKIKSSRDTEKESTLESPPGNRGFMIDSDPNAGEPDLEKYPNLTSKHVLSMSPRQLKIILDAFGLPHKE